MLSTPDIINAKKIVPLASTEICGFPGLLPYLKLAAKATGWLQQEMSENAMFAVEK